MAAVDVDRNDHTGFFGDLAKDPAERAPAPESRPEEEGGFPDLGVAVVEVVGEMIRGLESLGVAEEGLVVAEKRGVRHTSVWRRGMV